MSAPALQVLDNQQRVAVLLINVGTPDDPSPSSVRRYLREFLSDARVLDMSPIGRFLLLNLVILPFRPKKSAAAYQTIWTEQGSPLLMHSKALADRLQQRLQNARVMVAMRYGNPNLRDVLNDARGYEQIVLVPLYPQYASSSTGTAVEQAFRILGRQARVPPVHVVPPFFDDAGFLDSVASSIREATNARPVDHVLFSYHGLPVHQVQATTAAGHTCSGDETTTCCAQLTTANASCYRAQCMATTRALVERLRPASYSTSFQSRLGRARWLLPNTEHELVALAKAGKKRLAVACPSFVADCLETLEEIGVRAKELFKAHGGEELYLVPCVNSKPDWVDAVEKLVRRGLG